MKIRPRNNQVLVKRLPEEKQNGAIELPDSSIDKQQIGIIVDKGLDPKCDDLKPNDKVLFRKYAGDENPKEEELVLMSEEEIIGVILEEK